MAGARPAPAPGPSGPGVVLRQASRGRDWTLRSETNASAENVRALETGRLTTPGVMSVLAYRPIPRRPPALDGDRSVGDV